MFFFFDFGVRGISWNFFFEICFDSNQSAIISLDIIIIHGNISIATDLTAKNRVSIQNLTNIILFIEKPNFWIDIQ